MALDCHMRPFKKSNMIYELLELVTTRVLPARGNLQFAKTRMTWSNTTIFIHSEQDRN